MAWIFLEAVVALLLAVFIVWFTTAGSRKPPSLPPSLPTSARPPTDDESGEDTRNQ
jgi:hypothetical protein